MPARASGVNQVLRRRLSSLRATWNKPSCRSPVLVDALRAIRPPGKEEPGRFRPYGGSDNWVAKADSTGEEDKNRWEIIAHRPGRVDYTEVEIECISEGISYETVPSYWRAQAGPGIKMRVTKEEAVQLFSRLGYALTRQAASAAPQG